MNRKDILCGNTAILYKKNDGNLCAYIILIERKKNKRIPTSLKKLHDKASISYRKLSFYFKIQNNFSFKMFQSRDIAGGRSYPELPYTSADQTRIRANLNGIIEKDLVGKCIKYNVYMYFRISQADCSKHARSWANTRMAFFFLHIFFVLFILAHDYDST